MASASAIDFVNLFENLPSVTAEMQRSTESENSGVCWFRGQESYPDTEKLREFVNNADLITDDTEIDCAEYENPRTSAFFNISRDGDARGEQRTFITNKPWEYKIFDASADANAQGQSMRKFFLEDADKSMLFIGAARPKSLVELMEIATLLTVAESHFGFDFGHFAALSRHPWNFEVFHADTEEILLETVATCLQEYEAASACVAIAHFAGKKMIVSLYIANDAHELNCIVAWKHKTTKSAYAREFFRTLILWHN